MAKTNNFDICNNPEKLKAILSKGAAYVQEFAESIYEDKKAVVAFIKTFSKLTRNESFHWQATPIQKDFLLKFLDSYNALKNDIEKAGHNDAGHLFMHFYTYHDAITVEFGWASNDVEDHWFLWDSITTAMDIPIIAFSICFQGFQKLSYEYFPEDSEAADEEDEIPMFNFHPMRFEEYRNFSEGVIQYYVEYISEEDGILDLEDHLNLSSIVITYFNEEYQQRPKRYLPPKSECGFSVDSYMALATAHARFKICGSAIFTVSENIISEAKSIDLNSIKLNEINLPNFSQYIHFGPQKHLVLDPGWLVDGMYIESRGENGEIKFTLTAATDDKSRFSDWLVYDEPNFTQEIIEDEFLNLSLGDAMDKEQAARMKSYDEESVNQAGEMIIGMIDEGLSQLGLSKNEEDIPPIAEFAKHLMTGENRRIEIHSSTVARRYNVYKEAMKITLCALNKLAENPFSKMPEFIDSAPQKLVKQAHQTDPKKAKEAFFELIDLGYHPLSKID